MNEKSDKGLKPFFIKYMALLMGICYLANPMHRQISSVFHEISHVLEAPESILSHPQPGDPYYGSYEDNGHDYGAHDNGAHDNGAHDNGEHDNGEHHLASTDHRHDLLDLLDSIFDASDKQGSENDTALVLIKCDKHIGSQHIILPKIFPLTTSNNIGAAVQKVKKGYLARPEEPPQQVSA